MDVKNVYLEAVAVTQSQFPGKNLPEMAFVGRSNVGKSSLINVMINRKALARTSQSPGKTRTINFYNLDEEIYFVDLPGYGYAKISRSESEKWGKMIEDYLKLSPNLKAIVQLVDIRHEPSVLDCQMMEWIKFYNIKTIIAATKLDKINRSALDKHLKIISNKLSVNRSDIIPFSAQSKQGKIELWEKIHNYL